MREFHDRRVAALIAGIVVAAASGIASAETPEERFNLTGGDLIKPVVPVGPPALRKQAADGEPSAQYRVGTLLHEQGSRKEALRWFERAARQEHADAEYRMGLYHFVGWGGVSRDPAKAEPWFRRAAEQKHVEAAFSLAGLYYYGQGVARDYEEAAKWYEWAADQKHPAANHRLGVMYDHGEGVPVDPRMAFLRFSFGARYGDEDAQFAAGRALEFGRGTEPDLALAARYYEDASEQGVLPAKLRLGELLLRGEGVSRDVPRATKLIRQAADGGLPLAQNRMGMFYLFGEHGFPQSDPDARRWFQWAKERGSDLAAKNLALMDEWEAKKRTAAAPDRPPTPHEVGREIGALLRAMQESNRASSAPSAVASSGDSSCRTQVEARLVRCRTQFECLDCMYSWVCENRRSNSRCKPLNRLSYNQGEFFCDPQNGKRFDTREEVFADSCSR